MHLPEAMHLGHLRFWEKEVPDISCLRDLRTMGRGVAGEKSCYSLDFKELLRASAPQDVWEWGADSGQENQEWMIQRHALSKAQRRTLSAGQGCGGRIKEEELGISRQWRNSTSSHLHSLEKGMAGKGTVFCEPQRAWHVQSIVPGEENGSRKGESRLGNCRVIFLIEGQGWHSQLFICKSLPRKDAVDW